MNTAMLEQTIELAPFTPKPAEVEDEFRYGHRLVPILDADGKTDYLYQPLTPEDFLDPQEGDFFVQGTRHNEDVGELKSIIQYIHRHTPQTAVFAELKIEWGIPNLKNPAPDVSVIPNVTNPDIPRGSFEVQREGTQPISVFELVSPNYVSADYDTKPDIYAQAGVDEYIIIDSGLRRWKKDELNYSVTGYRMQSGQYVEMKPDSQGRVYSQINDAWIGPNTDKDGFEVINAQTGKRILSGEERADIAEERVDEEVIARLQAEERMEIAEAKAQQEAQARASLEAKNEENVDLLRKAMALLEEAGLSDKLMSK